MNFAARAIALLLYFYLYLYELTKTVANRDECWIELSKSIYILRFREKKGDEKKAKIYIYRKLVSRRLDYEKALEPLNPKKYHKKKLFFRRSVYSVFIKLCNSDWITLFENILNHESVTAAVSVSIDFHI